MSKGREIEVAAGCLAVEVYKLLPFNALSAEILVLHVVAGTVLFASALFTKINVKHRATAIAILRVRCKFFIMAVGVCFMFLVSGFLFFRGLSGVRGGRGMGLKKVKG